MAELETKAVQETTALCHSSNLGIHHFIDMRYKGQAYELTVPYQKNFIDRFHADHAQLCGYSMPEAELEIISIRWKAGGKRPG